MIFISEKRGRPVGSKNKSKGDISMPNELSKEEQRIFDILSTFAQKGLVDFNTGSVDNEEIMKSEDQELISLYTELVSTVKNRKFGGLPSKVIFKFYNTFSNVDVLYKTQEWGQYLRDQGYDFSTVDDADIPKDQMKKLYKDFESRKPTPEPTPEPKPEKSSEEIRAALIRTLHNFSLLSKYLKDDLNLDDNEIKSRIIALLRPSTDTPTLNEQILKDFKRFL